jgi:hypothetical protein
VITFGGLGTDTLTAQGFVLSADQRNAIFATASVERIVDASGTYTVDNANEAPAAVALANATVSVLENTSTASHIKVADINVTDDALGSNILALTGTELHSLKSSATPSTSRLALRSISRASRAMRWR